MCDGTDPYSIDVAITISHIPHTLLTLWALGADASIINKTYEENSKDQRDAFVSPNPITKENWKDYLGDEKCVFITAYFTGVFSHPSSYFQGYLEFFKTEVIGKDVSTVLEEYIFAPGANVGTGDNHPAMLNRLLAGLFHPLIHVGLGIEFGIPGTLAEGLFPPLCWPSTQMAHRDHPLNFICYRSCTNCSS